MLSIIKECAKGTCKELCKRITEKEHKSGKAMALSRLTQDRAYFLKPHLGFHRRRINTGERDGFMSFAFAS